jgi:predicted phage gp36 major capsid-like protein
VANHLRRQIREAVAGAVTGLATTGARVFQSRVYPLQTAELPGLLVYTRSETSEPITIHPDRDIERVLSLEIVAVAKANADLDDTLDQICKEVETVLAMPLAALNGKAKSIQLVSTEFDLQGSGERPTGSATMTFEVDYFNAENAPDVAL